MNCPQKNKIHFTVASVNNAMPCVQRRVAASESSFRRHVTKHVAEASHILTTTGTPYVCSV